jgi:Protein of unknown function (DUF3995)
MPMRPDPLVAATCGLLAAASGVHVVWGLRLPLPGIDRSAMADAVAGSQEVPSPTACFAVAGALGTASVLVGGFPARLPRLRRTGQVGVAAVLAGRAAIGLAGRTDLVAPGPPSERFLRWDRRLYTPLCAFLAAGATRAALRS